MSFMDSKESISRAITGTVLFTKNSEQEVNYCEDMILAMLKIAYEQGRADVLAGLSNDINLLEVKHSHTF